MAKPASLSLGLVKKGQAAPATSLEPIAAVQAPAVDSAAPTQPVPATPNRDYYKALTVKLDRERYNALKTACLQFDMTGQTLFVEAFDLWLQEKRRNA